jgi:hypothetical protein
MTGMPDTDPSLKNFQRQAAQLAKVMGVDDRVPEAWSESDLSAILNHQLAAPLALEVGAAYKRLLRTSKFVNKADFKTFRDLFNHSDPPVNLLKATKEFFKSHAGESPERRPEQKVAYLLYLASILAVRRRSGTSITKLSDPDLLRAVDWVDSQVWVDIQTRSIFAEARQELVSKITARG